MRGRKKSGPTPLCPISLQPGWDPRAGPQLEGEAARPAKEFFLLVRQPFRAHRRYTLQARAARSRPPAQGPSPSAAARQETGRQGRPLNSSLLRSAMAASGLLSRSCAAGSRCRPPRAPPRSPRRALPMRSTPPSFIGPRVALVDADDSRSASRDVVQDGFGHFEANPEPLKAGRQRAANVVQSPVFDSACLIERGLCLAEAIERCLHRRGSCSLARRPRHLADGRGACAPKA